MHADRDAGEAPALRKSAIATGESAAEGLLAVRDMRGYVTDLPFEREGISLASMSTVAEIKTAAGGLVVSNPGILGGTPVFRGTRLPVQTLFNYRRGRTLARLFPGIVRGRHA